MIAIHGQEARKGFGEVLHFQKIGISGFCAGCAHVYFPRQRGTPFDIIAEPEPKVNVAILESSLQAAYILRGN
jgi:hypothetical protein